MRRRAKALPQFVEVLRTGGAGTDGAKALPEYVEVLRTGWMFKPVGL